MTHYNYQLMPGGVFKPIPISPAQHAHQNYLSSVIRAHYGRRLTMPVYSSPSTALALGSPHASPPSAPPASPSDPLQRLRALVLGILTPEDIDAFMDMMERVKNALPATAIGDLQQLAAASIGVQLPGFSMGANVGAAVAAAGTGSGYISADADLDDAEEYYPPAPGYDALDPEDALDQVVRWIDAGEPDKAWKDANTHLATSSNRLLKIVITKQHASVGAMLAGTADATYHITDGRIDYCFTTAEINRRRFTPRLLAASQGGGLGAGILGSYTGPSLGGYVNSPAYSGNSLGSYNRYREVGVVGDRTDVIGGYNPDKLRLEEEKLRQVVAWRDSQKLDLNRSLKRISTAAQDLILPNPLTGVPDLLPDRMKDVQVDVETLQDLVNVHGEAFAQDALMSALDLAPAPPPPGGLIVPPPGAPAPPPCPAYIPAVPATDLPDIPALLAEAWRTWEFCISTCFVGDSKCAYILDEVTSRIARHSYAYATKADMLVDRELLVQALTEVHAITATAALPAPVALPMPVGGRVPIPGSTPIAYMPATTPALYVQPSGNFPTSGTFTSGNLIITNTSSVTPQVVQIPASRAAFIPAFDDDTEPYDRTFKLLPGHVYRLDDGSSIEVDAVGNYTIHDADAKITYRSSRMREFNRYVNGSDLLGEFIESLGALGASQKQAAAAPIEMFIRWLIFKAAEHDREEPPADVPPLSADELKDAALDDAPIDIVAMAESRRRQLVPA